jgi:ribosomal protein S6--L-glutamate ligase
MAEQATPFIIGWEEWVALPELGLPAIKAKVDTGARTSALHAFLIEPFGPASAPMVRFGIHPIPGRDGIEIYCSAPIIDRREVTSSNGEKETRFVISTRVAMGARTWPIEITLTNRESMAYRMLLGRQAIREDMFVDPAASFRQPRLSYRLYRHVPRHDLVRRALRIALLTRSPDSPTNRRLAAAAEVRGHVLEPLATDHLTLTFDGAVPGLQLDGAPLAHYDAVVPRLRADDSVFGAAIVRQLELMGSFSMNSANALDRRANLYARIQALTRGGVPHGYERLTADRGSKGSGGGHLASYLQFLVVGGRVVAAMERRRDKAIDIGERRLPAERALAERSANALRLGLAAIDIDTSGETPTVRRVSAMPTIGMFETVTGARVAEQVIGLIEARVRSWVRREEPIPIDTNARDGTEGASED